MNKVRQDILTAIRRNKVSDKVAPAPVQHTIPRRAINADKHLFELFQTMCIDSAATVDTIGNLAELPQAVNRYMSDFQFKITSLCLNSPLLVSLDWDMLSQRSELNVTTVKSEYCGDVSVTCAYCGIAETGSVVLLAGPDISSAAYFLPEVLIVALQRQEILAAQEFFWRKLRSAFTELPRTITFVTGPSRTGDIEQKLVIGAHGPGKLHVVIYDSC